MPKLDLPLNPRCAKVVFLNPQRAVQRQALERLYTRKAAVDALIQSLEDYVRCQYTAQVTPIALRGD